MKLEIHTCPSCYGRGEVHPLETSGAVTTLRCGFCKGAGKVTLAVQPAVEVPDTAADHNEVFASFGKRTRAEAKAAAYVAMYTPSLWRNGGLDSDFFVGRKDLWSEVHAAMNRKPVVIFDEDNYSVAMTANYISLPAERLCLAGNFTMLMGLKRETVIFDPFAISYYHKEWSRKLHAHFNNIVCGKNLVASVLAGQCAL